MASFKRFSTLAIFLVYLLFQFDDIHAEGLQKAESNPEELAIIKKFSEDKVPENDLKLSNVSYIEQWTLGIKDKYHSAVDSVKSWVPKRWRSFAPPTTVPKLPKISGADTITDFINKHRNVLDKIVPGTLWCGDGNKAKHYEELGYFNNTDACCRAHDNCPIGIGAGKTLGPLKNNGYFTRSWCACDEDFYNCLKNANNVVARGVGNVYFSGFNPQCFDYSYPGKCVKHSSFLHFVERKCIKYEDDTSKEKILQWKDTKDYVEAFNNK